MRPKCPTGCGRGRQPGYLMCQSCWFKVPVDLRREVWHTWRKCQRTGNVRDLQRYGQAREAAIASIA